MDENTLMMLIAGGEGEGVDFKRELHLDTREQKGEFVKDVISIANTAPDCKGYIFIGVNDDRLIVGTDDIDEDRLQQIAHRYIRPPVVLRTYMVPTTVADNATVGVIEIRGKQRPHSFASPIDRWNQDDTFVRHGSVVTKATTDEIGQMQNETLGYQLVNQYVRAAQTHCRLGNYTKAIDAYSQAIDLNPVSELFLARGNTYSRLVDRLDDESDENRRLADLATQDFANAIQLRASEDIETEARLGRLRLFNVSSHEWDQSEEDVCWLKEHAEGKQLGEALYLNWNREDSVHSEPVKALPALSQALDLGYVTPEVFELRAVAHYSLHNYGNALEDIRAALACANVQEATQSGLLSFRAAIFVELGRFREAHSCLVQARKLSEGGFTCWNTITSELDEAILWRYALALKFGALRDEELKQARPIVQLLGAVMTMVIDTDFSTDTDFDTGLTRISGSVTTGPIHFAKSHPEIAEAIRRLVGEEYWQLHSDGLPKGYTISFDLQGE